LYYSDDGDASKCGVDAGLGYNVNIPLGFNTAGYNNADYNYIFSELVLPLANRFAPDLIIVAAGFDSCVGDPTSTNKVTPGWFGGATKSLQTVSSAAGRVLLLLEGGYNRLQTTDCIDSCIQALLVNKAIVGNSTTKSSSTTAPAGVLSVPALEAVQRVQTVQSAHWSMFRR
jgi:acetoin utilization deacetylase AcuC-like enzyme